MYNSRQDKHGHDTVRVTALVCRRRRKSDSVARLGGDEFVIVLESPGRPIGRLRRSSRTSAHDGLSTTAKPRRRRGGTPTPSPAASHPATKADCSFCWLGATFHRRLHVVVIASISHDARLHADTFADDRRSSVEPGCGMVTCAICAHAMTEDWFFGAVERVSDAGREACQAIETAVDALRDGCVARKAGRSIVDVVDELIAAGGREVRLDAVEAFHEYERAIASMRADVVRALVDEGGLSLTDVAKRMKISRQAVARLYEAGPRHDDKGLD